MSSNQNDVKKVKVTSINNRIHWLLIWERVKRYFSTDLLLFIAAYIVLAASNAYQVYGESAVTHYEGLLVWNLSQGNGAAYFSLLQEFFWSGSIPRLLSYVGYVLGTLVFLQLTLGVLFRYPFEYRRVAKILQPINEIAIKADELSRMEFDEEKYHLLEEAITNLQPGADETVSIHNEDLKGIEVAMNNMLVRMRESYRQQSRFVNDASHELRTPIAVIEGYANMLARWGKTDEKILEESITAIQHESSHMKYLVEQLLFLARGDSGKTTLKLEETSLTGMMQEIYEESLMIDEEHPYRFSAAEKEIRLDVDSGLLKQAVRILVDNAAKYTAKGDEILLSVGRNENNRPYLQVQDTGIGMAGADMEHMFERFYRADEARNTAGTGLGLSIAKWIVDKHKGHFEILSVTELGTRIRIVL